jgi:CDP-diacylglycerol--glycerol-3-phosphate 3-phosphatidyltransferase
VSNSTNPPSLIEPQQQLQQELRRIAVLGIALLLMLALCLGAIENSLFASRWLLLALPSWGFMLWQCHRRLHLNYSTLDNKWHTTLGLGNRITLLRGLLIAATAGFLVTTRLEMRPLLLYLPAILYTGAALGDALDGYIARQRQQTTELGKELDTTLDALGLVIAPLLAVLYGKLHVSYLLVSVAYYLFQWGLLWRQRFDKPVYPLPPSRLRRKLAGYQMGLVATVLWPPLPAVITLPAGVLFMLPMLAGFIRDWFFVSGRLPTESEQQP